MIISCAKQIATLFFHIIRRILHRCIHLSIGLLLFTSYISLILICFIKLLFHRRFTTRTKKPSTCGFLHPFASDGGGGERVLWHIISSLLNSSENPQFEQFILYHTTPAGSIDSLDHKVHSHFGIRCRLPFHAKHNKFRIISTDASNLLPTCYHSLTLFRQAMASVAFVSQCFQLETPALLIDTFGVPFAYPLCHLMGVRVLSYVHYPFISAVHLTGTDATRGALYGLLKASYLDHLHRLYQSSGAFVSQCAVNSSWTLRHMQAIWQGTAPIHRIFPPVADVRPSVPVHPTVYTIVSVSQFRREKNHGLQLAVFHRLRATTAATFAIVGSVRNRADRAYLGELQQTAVRLGISADIRWMVNVSNSERKEILGKSRIAIHTMREEHFGIGIVECMAAGCICIAHASGGPRTDIINPAWEVGTAVGTRDDAVGFLATDVDSYLWAIQVVLGMSDEERRHMQQRANRCIQKFSSAVFTQSVQGLIKGLSVGAQ